MATINVGQLDDEVIGGLKERAARNNRSLEGEVRHILEKTVDDDMHARRAAFLAMTDRLSRLSIGVEQTPAERLIREDRNHGHRHI